jgi:hypothetical protein
VALANLAAAAAVNVGLFLVTLRVLTPSADPDPAAGRWCAGRWGRLAGPAGRRWLPGRPLPAPHQPGVRGVRDRPWPAVLGHIWARGSPQKSTSWPPDGSGRAAWYSRCWPTPTNAPPGDLTKPNRNADLRRPPGSASPPTSHTHEANAATPLPVAGHQQDVAAPQSSTPGQHRDVAGHDAPAGRRAPNGIGQRRARAWCRRRP